MIYKKYAIEVAIEYQVLTDITQTGMVDHNGFSLYVDKSPNYINAISYYNRGGFVDRFPEFYYTYESALKSLNDNYYTIVGYNNFSSVKIVELYDDVEPPLGIIRALKIKEIKSKI